MNPTPTPRRATALSTLAVLTLALALPACARSDAQKPAAKPASSDAVAEVGGETIGYGDLEGLLDPQARSKFRDTLDQVVEAAIARKLFELEAAKRGISVDDLIHAEIEAKAGEVTDQEIQDFYTENQARIQQPLEQIKPQIRTYLGQLRQKELYEALLTQLRDTYGARNLLPIDRMEVAEADSPAKGPENAPVTIIEFSDFECPFCGRVTPTLEQVLANYGDQVRLVFRQFPLTMHPHAQKAAEASLCAREQGKFWEMHDAMFADQKALGVDQLKAKAGELGLDAEAFGTCLDEGRFAAKIAADVADGTKAGVGGTPALFVNGRFLNGAQPYETIAKVIDDELQRQGVAEPSAESKPE